MPATLTAELSSAQRRVLADMDSHNLFIWRNADGTDAPDRPIDGGATTVTKLEELGLITAPTGAGSWSLTDAGASIAARL